MIRRHFLMNNNQETRPVIKYTTSDGSVYDILQLIDVWTSIGDFSYKGPNIISNTYSNIGEIIFDSPVVYTGRNDAEIYPIFSATLFTPDDFNILSLTSVTLPNTVKEIGDYTFLLCEALTSINIPEGVTKIADGAFQRCISLQSVALPDNLKTIGAGAFSVCTSLKSITIPNSVTSIGEYAFDGCSSLISIVWNAKNCESWPFGDISSQITSFTFGNEVEHIPTNLCYEMNNLTSVTIPNSVTSIGKYAFDDTGIYNDESNWENDVLYIDNCLIAAKTQISGAYTIKENTQLIAGGAFEDCSSLTSITIPNSVINIGDGAFRYCSSLTSVTIPNSVTSIGEKAFRGCESLTSVTIPNSVTSIRDHTFLGCSSLSSVTIGNSVTSIGERAFDDCSLTSITIPNSVTSIGFRAFDGIYRTDIFFLGTIEDWCKVSLQDGLGSYYLYLNDIKAEDIVIPDTISTINNYLFKGCRSLTSVTIPEGVTSIGDYAFSLCSLTSVTIPLSVVSIGLHGFSHSELNSINFNGTSSLWYLITKGNYWNINIPATVVHCTDGDITI